jgi:S1-C subfamily serine protease
MKKLTYIFCVVVFFSGCAGTLIDLKSPMTEISSHHETKAALYFKSFDDSPYKAFFRLHYGLHTRLLKSYALDIFSQVFSEVKIVSSLREVEETNSSIIISIEFSGLGGIGSLEGGADVFVFGKNGQELFSGQNISSTLNWTGSKKDFQDVMINTFLPIAKNLSQSPQVASYISSEKTSHYAKQFVRSRRIEISERTSPPDAPQSGTGSGFFVSKMGHVITNAHVVHNCNKVTIGDNANKQVPAEVVNTDKSNDLALLKLSTLEMASAESKSLIKKLGIVVVPLASKGLLRDEDVRLGEKVLVAGYPFGDTFSNTIKVTTGVVSATRGAGDNSGQFQLDAAVQPGNSGGPIYDSGGNIVGVVVAQLNKRTFGSFVENMNFGIKASTVRQFLVASGINSKKSERTEEKSTEQLAEIAKNQALMVMCLQ